MAALNEVIQKDREYFMGCFTYLLKQDQKLVRTYLKIK